MTLKSFLFSLFYYYYLYFLQGKDSLNTGGLKEFSEFCHWAFPLTETLPIRPVQYTQAQPRLWHTTSRAYMHWVLPAWTLRKHQRSFLLQYASFHSRHCAGDSSPSVRYTAALPEYQECQQQQSQGTCTADAAVPGQLSLPQATTEKQEQEEFPYILLPLEYSLGFPSAHFQETKSYFFLQLGDFSQSYQYPYSLTHTQFYRCHPHTWETCALRTTWQQNQPSCSSLWIQICSHGALHHAERGVESLRAPS